MEYSSEVLRRFDSARHGSARVPDGPGRVGTGEAWDRTLQVWVRFDVRVSDGTIESAQFQAFGCPHTIAAASWVAEWLEGRPVEFLGRLDVGSLRTALDVPVDKLGKLLRIQDALERCLHALERSDSAKER